MPNYSDNQMVRVIISFNWQNQGWEEQWYAYNQGNLFSTFANIRSTVLTPRANLLGSPVFMDGVQLRAADGSAQQGFFPPNLPGARPLSEGAAVTVWDVLMCEVENNQYNVKRKLMLRGCAGQFFARSQTPFALPVPNQLQDIISSPEPNVHKTSFLNLLNSFTAFAVGNPNKGLFMRAISRTGLDNQPFVIKDIVANAGALTISGTWAVNTFLQGTKVRVKHCRGFNGRSLNGIYYVLSQGANLITVAQKVSAVAFLYTGGGALSSRVYDYYPVTGISYLRYSKKPVGAPHYGTDGQKKKRK